MAAQSYVNGLYGPTGTMAIAIEDRAVQFADSVYEVVAFLNGRLADWDAHMWRFKRNLAALFIDGVPEAPVLAMIARRLIRRGHLGDGTLYLQGSRGAAPRAFPFPEKTAPGLIMTARPFDFRARRRQLGEGVRAVTLPDDRWRRSDMKTTGLLAAALAKEEAQRAGAAEAILVRDGVVTEGASSNIFMLRGDRLYTHPLGRKILPGVGRGKALALARQAGLAIMEEPFSLADMRKADELFLTSTSTVLLPIVAVDGAPVGDGRPGHRARQLGQMLWNDLARQTGWRA